MLATGSYGQTTAIYREDNMELLYILHGQQGGVRDMCNSQKMVTIYIQGGNRTLTYSAGTYAKLLTLCLSCIDLQKIPISGYCLILILLVSILVQAVRTDWFIFIISKWGSGYQAFKLHWALHQGRFVSFDDSLEDFSLSGDENCASIWSFAYASMADNATCMDSGDSNLCQDPCIVCKLQKRLRPPFGSHPHDPLCLSLVEIFFYFFYFFYFFSSPPLTNPHVCGGGGVGNLRGSLSALLQVICIIAFTIL